MNLFVNGLKPEVSYVDDLDLSIIVIHCKECSQWIAIDKVQAFAKMIPSIAWM